MESDQGSQEPEKCTPSYASLVQTEAAETLVENAWAQRLQCSHMSYSLNSLKGGYIRDYIGDCYRGY